MKPGQAASQSWREKKLLALPARPRKAKGRQRRAPASKYQRARRSPPKPDSAPKPLHADPAGSQPTTFRHASHSQSNDPGQKATSKCSQKSQQN